MWVQTLLPFAACPNAQTSSYRATVMKKLSQYLRIFEEKIFQNPVKCLNLLSVPALLLWGDRSGPVPERYTRYDDAGISHQRSFNSYFLSSNRHCLQYHRFHFLTRTQPCQKIRFSDPGTFWTHGLSTSLIYTHTHTQTVRTRIPWVRNHAHSLVLILCSQITL